MARHLKTIVMNRLKYGGATFEDLPPTRRTAIRHRRRSGHHSRGVRYFRTGRGIEMLWGAMDSVKEGQKYKKRIVVRPSRFRSGLHELYTYHFPKTWSAACVANREMIKEAQRQAHALEHSSTPEALEWRIRFFRHYFNVVKGHATPEPGLKPYSRFYQYTYVAIYRELQAEAARIAQNQPQPHAGQTLAATPASSSVIPASAITDAYLRHLTEDVTFEPIKVCSFQGNSIARYRSIFRSPSSCISRASLREHLSLPRPSPPRADFSRYYANGLRLPLSVST